MDCWYLYVLECAGGRLYTGIARDPQSRYKAHASGKGAKFTRSYPPIRILMTMPYDSRSDALKAEYALKKLSAEKKRSFILNQSTGPSQP